MRLGIRAKQIAGVTAIVGLAVVALSALYVTRVWRASCCTRATRAGSCWRSAIFHRARAGGHRQRATRTRRCATTPACARSSSPASTARASPAPSIVDTSGVVVASSDPHAGRQRPPRRSADLAQLMAANALSTAAGDLLARRPDARSAPADDARRRGVRLDPRRRVHAADAAGAERVAGAGAAAPRRCALVVAVFVAGSSRSCCCGRFT